MKKFYSSWPNVEIFPFTIEEILNQVEEEKKNDKRIVFLLDSSITNSFGLAQSKFFCILTHSIWTTFLDQIAIIKEIEGNVIQDVFPIEECSKLKHPIHFTRFIKNALPFGVPRGFDRTILICPNVGNFGLLSQPLLVDTLIEAQGRFKLPFLVKFHGLSFLENHPLFSLTPVEQESMRKLQQNCASIDSSHYSALPFIKAIDIVSFLLLQH